MKKKIFLTVTLAALLGSVALLFTRYIDSFYRICTGVLDLFTSIVYYFVKIFANREPTMIPTVNTIPNVDLQKFIPFDLDELVRKWNALGGALFQKEYFQSYLLWLSDSMRKFLVILLLIVPIVMLLSTVFNMILIQEKSPKEHGKDTRVFAWFKRRVFPIYFTVAGVLKDYKNFLRDHPKTCKFFVFVWLCNLNVLTILIEFFAFYLYFAAAIELSAILPQFLKLLIDLIIMFSGAPFLFWAIVGYVIFDYVRAQIGYVVLNAHEASNRAFIEELPIVCMLCGSMGTGKTTMLVDMTLSQSVMFRDKAHKKMLEYQARLPNFPWILFEDDLISEMPKRRNLTLMRLYGRFLGKRFECTQNKALLFGYDHESYRTSYDNGLSVQELS